MRSEGFQFDANELWNVLLFQRQNLETHVGRICGLAQSMYVATSSNTFICKALDFSIRIG